MKNTYCKFITLFYFVIYKIFKYTHWFSFMPIYKVSSKINSNISPDYILYDLLIYRMNGSHNKTILLDVKKQQLKSNYETQQHDTENTNDPISTIYIVEITLYRTNMLQTTCVSVTPFRRMYTLEELSTRRAFSSVKRENPCYYESKGKTQLESEGRNIKTITISNHGRAFIAKEYPENSANDPFAKNKVEGDIFLRFHHMDFPDQSSSSLCGPAVFFYCLQADRPDIYMQAANELWLYGQTKIGDLQITPSKGCRHPSGKFYDESSQPLTPLISGLDWLTLASLRDSENTVFSYDSVDYKVSGISMFDSIAEWFEKAGYEKVFDNVGITRGTLHDIRALNTYIKQGYRVITLIADSLLESSESNLTIPSHWIVWDGEVTEDANGKVSLQLFSWGTVNNWIKKDKDIHFFINRFFGGMVFKSLT